MNTVSVAAAFLRRDFRINISYRASFALQSLAILFQLALFFYLSRVVDQSVIERQGLSGGYFGYAAMGLALLTIVQVSMGSFSFKLREEQTTGTFEALMTTPTSPWLIVLCSAGYELIRATVAGLLLIGAAVVLFGLRLSVDPLSMATAAAALLGCLGLFASLGVAVAAAMVVIKRATALLSFVITTLALLGGVYFPIEVLPEPIEKVASALPFTWGVDVFRASLLGGEVDPAQFAGLLGSAALLLPIALVGFMAAVRRARQTGTLAQY